MSTHSTSDIAHINMRLPKMMSCDYIKPPRSALTSPMVALPTLTFPANAEGIFDATDNAIVKHIFDRITIVVRVFLLLHTRCFVF